ncbi:MAG: inositol monophosphatase [Gammaproteobacteria bacterium]|nr:inositol monophosphatase [Gammaproteobacteria bacterium]MDH3414492.1 inositol monophosphatase [Gammaproteobacteria bacterium]
MSAVESTSGTAGGGDGNPRERVATARRQELLQAALQYADCCREVISQTRSHGVEVDAKPDLSLVTNADLAAERAFRQSVEQDFPDMGIIGEEFGASRPEAAYQWVIDPVDGTADFARELPTWGCIIGVFFEGEPIVGVIDHPDLGLRMHAAHGLGAYCNNERMILQDTVSSRSALTGRVGVPSRSSFTRCSKDGHVFDALVRAHPDFRTLRTCLTHTYAATGQLDAAVEWDANIWDLAATRILIEEAGGRYLCVREREQQGAGMLYSAVFGRPALVDRIAAMLGAHI